MIDNRWYKKKKSIYLYDMKMNFLKKFDTTDDFVEYSGYDRMYIYHNLKYCKKIKINGGWYIIKREKI